MLVGLASLAVLAVLSPARAQGPGAPLPVRIGYQPGADWLTIQARNEKLFEKVGLAPTHLKFVAGPPMVAAAASKSVDVVMPSTVPFITGLAQGIDWVIIGIATEYAGAEGFVVRRESGINSPADLKGKTISVMRGTTSDYGLQMLLKKHGLAPDQVTILLMPPAQQIAGMLNKNIDASAIWEPWMQKMIHQAGGKVLATESDIGVHTAVSMYLVRREWLRENRETAVRVVRALLLASDQMEKDRTDVLRSYAQEVGIEEGWAEAIYKAAGPPKVWRWTDPGYQYSIVNGSPFHRQLTELAKFLYETKQIPKPVDVSNVLDSSVVAEVLKGAKRAR
jgi:ABC-type nitrate/sulfonate/bicarbonate transport system substrate-binding protein